MDNEFFNNYENLSHVLLFYQENTKLSLKIILKSEISEKKPANTPIKQIKTEKIIHFFSSFILLIIFHLKHVHILNDNYTFDVNLYLELKKCPTSDFKHSGLYKAEQYLK